MPAQYLLRFDDICPTMNWDAWTRVEQAMIDARVSPLLAVVPDNLDPVLTVAAAVPDFWHRVREWQARGWSIGLHGFQHRYETKSSGIVGRNRYSEFAGLPRDAQRSKLERALGVFDREGVRADAWVAPGHSFDGITVELLAALGVPVVSDGYSLFPYVCARGMQWIPQQLGRFRGMPFGTWTVCHHINAWTDADIRQFNRDLSAYRDRIGNLKDICARYGRRPQSAADRLFFASFRAARAARG